MTYKTTQKLITIILSTIVFATLSFSIFATSHMKDEPTATIEISNWKVGFIIGYGGGSGTLTHEGKSYPLTINGLRVGATVGIAKADLVGEVYNLTKPEDIEGIYNAAQVAGAIGAGGKASVLENSKGVKLKLKGKQVGIEIALDISGMSVKLK